MVPVDPPSSSKGKGKAPLSKGEMMALKGKLAVLKGKGKWPVGKKGGKGHVDEGVPSGKGESEGAGQAKTSMSETGKPVVSTSTLEKHVEKPVDADARVEVSDSRICQMFPAKFFILFFYIHIQIYIIF